MNGAHHTTHTPGGSSPIEFQPDRREPFKPAILAGFDLLYAAQQEGRSDLVRLYFIVGKALLILAEQRDYDRDMWSEGMLFIAETIFGRQPEHPDIATIADLFRRRLKTARAERKRSLQ